MKKWAVFLAVILAACGGGDPADDLPASVQQLVAQRQKANLCQFACGPGQWTTVWVSTPVYANVQPSTGTTGIGITGGGSYSGLEEFGLTEGGMGIVGDITYADFANNGDYLSTSVGVYLGTDGLVRTVDLELGVIIQTTTIPNPSPDGSRRVPIMRKMRTCGDC